MSPRDQPVRRRTAVWSALLGYATLACGVARNVLLVPLYLAFVSLEEYGAWLATGGALVQLLVSDYGISGVILRRVARTFGADDRPGLALTIVLELARVAVTPFLPDLLDLDSSSCRRVSECFLIAILANAVAVFATVGTSVLRGLQQPVAPGSVQLGAELVLMTVTVALLFANQGLYAFAWGMLARSVLVTGGVAIAMLGILRSDPGVQARFALAEGLRQLVDSTSLFLVSASMKLLSPTDVLLVGSVIDARAAAVYGLTTRLVHTVSMFLSELNVALAPGLAHLFGTGDHRRFRALLEWLVPVLGALTLAGIGTAAAVSADIVALWVGTDQFGGTALAYTFAAATFLSAIGYLGYDALMATGRFRFIAVVFVASAASQVALALVLLRSGAIGAPAAAIVSALVWARCSGGKPWPAQTARPHAIPGPSVAWRLPRA